MIDNENEVVQAVKTALLTDYPNMPVYSITTLAPETFPCVCVEMMDNYTYKPARTTSAVENMAQVMYEVNVYSNKTTGKKAEAKAIFDIIDTTLTGLFYTREYTRPVNMDNGTAYRLIGRYKGIISKKITTEV